MAKKTMIAVATAAATTFLLNKKGIRAKITQTTNNMYDKVTGRKKKKEWESQVKIGHSHPHDYEDNKMVGEGALTSIQHYNQKQQKNG
ncbi:hypothetical protein [Halalkalibacter okhensis]|uniref:Uncharacterized protein n=1 Tax=Halalkalibacter okhensis TaxID=333138 RepID=A0A0B0I7M2_9BACI|nr:hypothetical protein [Halalkalibacter okhensis]KHF38438.1 hypothetical protein LQ50_21470 [Halalkalibacter okhensis]